MRARSERILILGGTAEARDLARRLVEAGFDVTTSLAGATGQPIVPPGRVRTGGFGGADGLGEYLAQGGFAAVADATHPFAVRISHHAAEATGRAGLPCLRLDRPAWAPGPHDRWREAGSAEAAAGLIEPGRRVLLTIGRKDLGPFLARRDLGGVIRIIEAPEAGIAPAWRILRARPPFAFEAERDLLKGEAIEVLVAKNAGGDLTRAKLEAARALRLPVLMIARPAKPAGLAEPTVEALVHRLMRILGA